MLEVGNMQVVLLKKRASSELDTYKITIQKPRLVGVDTYANDSRVFCILGAPNTVNM